MIAACQGQRLQVSTDGQAANQRYPVSRSIHTLKPVRLIKSFGQNLNWKNTLFEDAYRDWRYYFKVRANKVHPSFGLSVSLSVWLLIFCGHLVVVCAYNLVIYPFIHQVMSQIQWTSFCYSFFQFWLWRSSCLIFNANFFEDFLCFTKNV